MASSDLDRFLGPQADTFDDAMAEIEAGHKTSHWMWWVFPQLASLGSSDRAKYYGLRDVADARAYLAHPVLGPRLLEATRAMLAHAGADPIEILGAIDARKLRSMATLFAAVPGAPSEFAQVLAVFYDDRPCERTREALSHPPL